MDHASQNTCKMNNINMLQAGNCSVAMLVEAIKTAMHLIRHFRSNAQAVSHSWIQKIPRNTFKRVCRTSNHFLLNSSGQRMHPSSCLIQERSAFVWSKNSVNKSIWRNRAVVIRGVKIMRKKSNKCTYRFLGHIFHEKFDSSRLEIYVNLVNR